MRTGREIRLTEAAAGWWVARDVDAEVTSQGDTRKGALEHLDEAVTLADGEVGHEPTGEALRDRGIDPETACPAALNRARTRYLGESGAPNRHTRWPRVGLILL